MRAYIQMNTAHWEKSLKLYAELSGKDLAEVHNQAAIDIAFRAMGKTKKRGKKFPVRAEDSPRLQSGYKAKGTGKGKSIIQKEIGPIAKRARKMVGIKGYRVNQESLYYALATKAGHRKGGGRLTKEAQRIYVKRRTASGYTAAAWGKAITSLGAYSKNPAVRKFLNHGASKHGRGEKATVKNKVVIISNTAAGSEEVGKDPMVEAARYVHNDRMKYIRRKLFERAKAASGRKK